jgi:hypothetical protein
VGRRQEQHHRQDKPEEMEDMVEMLVLVEQVQMEEVSLQI